jgi:hypothetical protein
MASTPSTTQDQRADTASRPPASPRRAGPPLVLPALASALLFLAGMVVGSATGAMPPLPTASAAEVLSYYRQHQNAVTLIGFLQFGSAIPLAIFAATGFTYLRKLGMDVPGATIGLVGGVLAAAMLALCGVLQWVGARTAGLDDPAVSRVVQDLVFMTGGVAHVVPLGLLIAGLAVPGLMGRLLPGWLAWIGVVLAVIAELSSLALLTPIAMILLPIARFGGLLWLIVVGALLPTTRRQPWAEASRSST